MTISRKEFEDRKRVAIELLKMRSTGTVFWPFVDEWAQRYAIMDPAYSRPPTAQRPIIAALTAAPLEGMTSTQIADAAELSRTTCNAVLCSMASQGTIFQLKKQMYSRYFLTAERMEAGRPLVFELWAEIERKKQQVVDTAAVKAKATKLQHKPKPHQAFTIKEKPAPPAPKPIAQKPAPVLPAPRPKITESVFIPPGLKVQQLPSSPDTRYTPSPGAEGAGFMADWAAKRAPKK